MEKNVVKIDSTFFFSFFDSVLGAKCVWLPHKVIFLVATLACEKKNVLLQNLILRLIQIIPIFCLLYIFYREMWCLLNSSFFFHSFCFHFNICYFFPTINLRPGCFWHLLDSWRFLVHCNFFDITKTNTTLKGC